MAQGGTGNRMGDQGRQLAGQSGGFGMPMGTHDPWSTPGLNGFNRNGPIPPGTMTPGLQNTMNNYNQNLANNPTPGTYGFGRNGPLSAPQTGGLPPATQTGGNDYSRPYTPPTIQNQPSPSMLPGSMDGNMNSLAMSFGGGQFNQPAANTATQSSLLTGTQEAPGGVMGADGQMYSGRGASPRAATGGAFNPAANQWGDYSQAVGDGLWGTDANGINRVNGHVFAASGLTSGNSDFQNWMQRHAPMYQQQNGQINMGQAFVGPRGASTPADVRGGSIGDGGVSGIGNAGAWSPGDGTPGSPNLGRSIFGGGTTPQGGGMFGPRNPQNGPGVPPIDPRTGRPLTGRGLFSSQRF